MTWSVVSLSSLPLLVGCEEGHDVSGHLAGRQFRDLLFHLADDAELLGLQPAHQLFVLRVVLEVGDPNVERGVAGLEVHQCRDLGLHPGVGLHHVLALTGDRPRLNVERDDHAGDGEHGDENPGNDAHAHQSELVLHRIPRRVVVVEDTAHDLFSPLARSRSPQST